MNYFAILLVCCLLEIIFITNHAQEAQLLMRTAADMALEQIQVTDDYFTSGGGYIMNGTVLNEEEVNRSYLLTANVGSKFEKVKMFPALTGQYDLGAIYNSLYGGNQINSYIKDSIDNGSSVLSLRNVAGVVPHGDSAIIKFGDQDVEISISRFNIEWYSYPKICMMGNTIVDSKYHKLKELDTGLNVNWGTTGSSETLLKEEIWNMYDLKNTSKKMTINGETIEYYLTPISLGITYINEDLLQALFINNLDLLMRSKYTTHPDCNLNSKEYGNGMLSGAFYPELVDTDTLDYLNPINNGAFTLLRGKRMYSTGEGAYFYEGTVKPKIEYIVIDAYKDTSENNELLRQIYGPRLTKKVGADVSWDSEFLGKTVSGSLFREMDAKMIEEMESMTGTTGVFKTIYDNKPIVVAKVTFYADFIIPYSTVSLREMRGREMNNSIGGRLLFNPFSESSNTDGSSLEGNYVDLEIKTKSAMDGNPGVDLIYPEDYAFTREPGMNSDAMTYTTYFAITP